MDWMQVHCHLDKMGEGIQDVFQIQTLDRQEMDWGRLDKPEMDSTLIVFQALPSLNCPSNDRRVVNNGPRLTLNVFTHF